MRGLRVCLLVPAVGERYVRVPLAALLAAARLRADGHEVTVWDERLAELPPALEVPGLVVVFTAVGPAWPVDLTPVRAALDRVRRWYPGVPVLAVGPHSTTLPGSTLLDLAVEHVAVGEAASAAVHGVRDLVSGMAPPVLYGGLSRPLPPTVVVGSHPLPYRNVNHWPPPAHDLVPLAGYTAEVVVDGVPRRVSAGVVRAAPGRPRTVDRVLAEIEVQRAADLEHVVFLDEVFGADARAYGEICDRLRGRNVAWTGRTTSDVVLRTDVGLWARAGCRGMWLDSGPWLREAALRLSRAGITPCVSLLVGEPGGTCVPDPPARFTLGRFVLRPGTAAFDRLAPSLGGGTAPATWQGVLDVNRRYRQRHRDDLDELERRLAALPHHLPLECEVPC
ncbi:radical SAM protein [Streptomyces ossamyceticus]|nr:radical SAM protein [Streptomyces ossamyceticus]